MVPFPIPDLKEFLSTSLPPPRPGLITHDPGYSVLIPPNQASPWNTGKSTGHSYKLCSQCCVVGLLQSPCFCIHPFKALTAHSHTWGRELLELGYVYVSVGVCMMERTDVALCHIPSCLGRRQGLLKPWGSGGTWVEGTIFKQEPSHRYSW